MRAETSSLFRIELLGNLRVVHRDYAITRFRLQKAGLLLASLAISPHFSSSRERLIEQFWSTLAVEAGRQNLSTTLSCLKRDLDMPDGSGSGVLCANRRTISLVSQRVTTDVAEFETLLKRARNTEGVAERACLRQQAIDLYRGSFLTGYYEEWALREQAVLQEHYGEALADWAQDLERQQEWQAALGAAQQAIKIDPFRETATLVLMRILARQGQTVRAIEAFQHLQARLRKEMNIEPARDLRQLVKLLQSNQDALCERRSETLLSGSAGLRTAEAFERGRTARSEPTLLSGRDPGGSPTSTTSTAFTQTPSSAVAGGAVPIDAVDYIVRQADAELDAAILRRESIVQITGPKNMGKTSLLARGVDRARRDGATVVLTDLQKLSTTDLISPDSFYRALAQGIADQLESDVAPESIWSEARSPNANFERFVRHELLGRCAGPVVWGLDEVDRLFYVPFRNDVFALFRSWHSERALDPGGPWGRLTLLIAYATEAYLFLSDMNRSPFQIGACLTLGDFTLEQVVELSARCRCSLTRAELKRFFRLVGGNPYLVRRGLHEVLTRSLNIEAFEAQADQDDGCFGEDLNRVLGDLIRSPELCEAVRALLQRRTEISMESFYRLRSAGVLIRNEAREFDFRSPIYRTYLQRHL